MSHFAKMKAVMQNSKMIFERSMIDGGESANGDGRGVSSQHVAGKGGQKLVRAVGGARIGAVMDATAGSV